MASSPNRRAVRWLRDELPELVAAGAITPESSRAITEYYDARETRASHFGIVLLSALGSFLVAAGIVLLVVHNWDQFSRPVRSVFAFAPLLAAQVLTAFVLLRRDESKPWRESAAIFNVAAVWGQRSFDESFVADRVFTRNRSRNRTGVSDRSLGAWRLAVFATKSAFQFPRGGPSGCGGGRLVRGQPMRERRFHLLDKLRSDGVIVAGSLRVGAGSRTDRSRTACRQHRTSKFRPAHDRGAGGGALLR